MKGAKINGGNARISRPPATRLINAVSSFALGIIKQPNQMVIDRFWLLQVQKMPGIGQYLKLHAATEVTFNKGMFQQLGGHATIVFAD